MLEDLITHYLSTLARSRSAIEDVQANLPVPLPLEDIYGAMAAAAQNLMDRWASGQKGVRTAVALEVIPDYPHEMLLPSLLLDAEINLLDDLIDEKLSAHEKSLLVLELLRVIALLDEVNLSSAQRHRIALYVNKCVSIAVSEPSFYAGIKQSSSDEQRLTLAVDSYLMRGQDADIFFELPLMVQMKGEINLEGVLALGRIDRALTLLAKDWGDVEHDRANDLETPVTLLCVESGDCLAALAERLKGRVWAVSDPVHPMLAVVAGNLRKHIKSEYEKCLRLGASSPRA